MKQPILAAISAALLLTGCTTVVYPPQPVVEEYRTPLIVEPQGPAVLFGNPRVPYWAQPRPSRRYRDTPW